MIGIVILNYCSWDDTKMCVESIVKNKLEEEYIIIVVDNASPNKPDFNWESFVSQNEIDYIQSSVNKGYNAGNNLGIARAKELGCDAILISNADVRYTEECIQRMKRYLDAHKNVGIVGPRVLDENGVLQKDHIFCKTGIIEKYCVRTRANIFFRKMHAKYFGYDKDYDSEQKVHAVLGCCFMMSKKCFEKVTPFDEYPFLYEEEFILGMQMENAGYETMYIPDAVIFHMHGGSTKFQKAFSFAHNVRSEIYYFRKYLNASKWQIYPMYLYRTLLYLLRCIRFEDFRNNWSWYLEVCREEIKK